MKGIAVLIGLNRVDPNFYSGWDGALPVCEKDATDLADFLKKKKFVTKNLLTQTATRKNVLAEIDAAAKALKAGDSFVLYYSGHGGQIPDLNSKKIVDGGDEADGLDETWCLYDGELIDDILFQRWFKFKAGVKILVLSDSCHSGSVIKVMAKPDAKPQIVKDARVIKLLPKAIAIKVFAEHEKEYKAFNKKECPLRVSKTKPLSKNDIKASVLLISGCQDNQLSEAQSFAYPTNSLFTGMMLEVVARKKSPTNYESLQQTIAKNLPEHQQPNLMQLGKLNTSFETQKPFKL